MATENSASEPGHLSPFKLLPTKTGTCEQCAVNHEPDQPHNQQSLTYQYWFYNKHGRWPTWKDAMEHCPDKIKEHWTKELTKLGVKL